MQFLGVILNKKRVIMLIKEFSYKDFTIQITLKNMLVFWSDDEKSYLIVSTELLSKNGFLQIKIMDGILDKEFIKKTLLEINDIKKEDWKKYEIKEHKQNTRTSKIVKSMTMFYLLGMGKYLNQGVEDGNKKD